MTPAAPAPTVVVLVEGTWGGDWARASSAFCAMLRAANFAPMRFQGWSGDVDGVPTILHSGTHSDWIAGGYGLRYFLASLAPHERNVICHSHGINPVLYALALEGAPLTPVRNLISVCSPVRRDMQGVARDAVGRIGRWRHLASQNGDVMQLLGELFDGHIGWHERQWRVTDAAGRPASNIENLTIPGIGHSGLFTPRFLDLWKTDGMLDFLRAPRALAEAVYA